MNGTPSPRFSVRVGQALRRYFVTGLATLFPVAVTIWLLVVIFNFADGLLGRHFGIPGVGLLVTVVVILIVGIFSIHFGKVVLRTFETWFSRLPLVKKVYPAAKQFAAFLFDEESRKTAFKGVVLVEYPRPGIYSIAVVTNESTTDVTGQSQTLMTLMIPTPPSPLTGPIIFVPKEQVTPMNMTIEDAFKLVLSGGVVAPPLQAASRAVVSR